MSSTEHRQSVAGVLKCSVCQMRKVSTRNNCLWVNIFEVDMLKASVVTCGVDGRASEMWVPVPPLLRVLVLMVRWTVRALEPRYRHCKHWYVWCEHSQKCTASDTGETTIRVLILVPWVSDTCSTSTNTCSESNNNVTYEYWYVHLSMIRARHYDMCTSVLIRARP